MSEPPVITLRPRRARPLWVGHPWVYSGAIAHRQGEVHPGALVAVHDAEGRRIGWGHACGGSIAVRMLTWSEAPPDEARLVAERLRAAHARRRGLVASASPGAPPTDAYRVVFGEGDRLPGLVVDRLGDGAVVQLGTAGMARLQGAIVDAVRAELAARWIVVQVPEDAARIEGIAAASHLVLGDEDAVARAVVHEDGLQFGVDPLGGQKTGFYADQRDNRRRVAALAEGRRVLDAYCYGAGFGIHALCRGGARNVTAVDTSARALRLARRNAELNGADSIEFVREDVVRFLRERGPDAPWDLIVLDPPKFVRSRQHLSEGLKKYRKLNELAIRSLPPGGLLATCSCSGHVSLDDFLRMLGEAAYGAGRFLHVLEVHGQPADHPFAAACPQSRYLKCVIAAASPR